jgi:hypothetical protein
MSVSLGMKPQSGKPAEKKELPLMSHEDLVRSIQHNYPNMTREEIKEQRADPSVLVAQGLK